MAQRFPIKFDPAYRVLSTIVPVPPSDSYLEVDGDRVYVRMAWGFRARFPKSAVRSVAPYGRRPMSRGVHGFARRWLVNGSGQGILSIKLDPPARAYVTGFPIRLRELLISLEDPDAARAMLTPTT